MTNQKIDFKDPLWISHFLDTALKKEKEKYETCPVNRDIVPQHEAAEIWGYVVASYFLMEESFKALLFLRSKHVPKQHSLTLLFDLFDNDDKNLLRDYYSDYLATADGYQHNFPFATLDDFLANLDGNPNKQGAGLGSFDWRYFLIEKKKSRSMPLISIELLHEVIYGCIRMVDYAHNGNFDPSEYTRSRRLCRKLNGIEKFDVNHGSGNSGPSIAKRDIDDQL